MLVLKFARELIWSDLKNIETPRIALNTVQRVHGSKYTLESIRNAHKHDLPRANFKAPNPYAKLKNQLENGRIFLINHRTQAPIFKTLELSENDHVNWVLNGHLNEQFKLSVRSILNRIQKPRLYSVLRDEPTSPKDDKQQKDEVVFENHQSS